MTQSGPLCTDLLVVCVLIFRLKSMGLCSWGRTCDFQSTSLLREVYIYSSHRSKETYQILKSNPRKDWNLVRAGRGGGGGDNISPNHLLRTESRTSLSGGGVRL